MAHARARREVEGPGRRSRPARANRPALPAGLTAVLHLQRLAGNAATSALLGDRPQVQRYDTGEHGQMGSDEQVTVNGVAFTQKQMTAMADLYGSVEDMERASPDQLKRVRDLIATQTTWYETGGKKGRDVDNKEWNDATGGHYLELAEANEAHFAPGRLSSGHDHKTAWQEHHGRALLGARAAAAVAGSRSTGVPAEAKVVNDFGNHFLTDAFSAGHLLAKRDLMVDAQRSFGGLEYTDGWYFHQNVFTDTVAELVMRDPTARAEFDKRYLKLIAWDDIDAERLSEFLFQMSRRRPEMFFSLFAKMVHDTMNSSIEGPPGTAIEVENDRGDTWYLTGDGTLNRERLHGRTSRTLDIIQQAIHQSDLNLEEAASGLDGPRPGPMDGFPLHLPEFFERVWSYTPRLTAMGRKNAEKARRTFTDAGSRAAAVRYAGIIVKQLPTVIDELTKNGYLREKHPTGRPPAKFS